jgi:hypothetical protein
MDLPFLHPPFVATGFAAAGADAVDVAAAVDDAVDVEDVDDESELPQPATARPRATNGAAQ